MEKATSTRATARTASASAAHAAPGPAAARATRALRIDQYARGQTGVCYYQVDIELRSICPHQDEKNGNGLLEACVEEDDVQCYAVRRRYNEFLQLYDKIKEDLATLTLITGERCELPPFPQKEYISSSVLGLLWRTSSSSMLLEERRAKFETLLCWIESHPVLRHSAAFVDFLGQPPQRSEGYVSLKEYSSQNWLSSLEKLTKQKEKRRLRSSSDCSSCSVLQQEQARRTKKRRKAEASSLRSSLSESMKPSKRQRRQPESKSPRAKTIVKSRKKKRTLSDQGTTSGPVPQEIVEVAWTAHVESSPIHKRKKME